MKGFAPAKPALETGVSNTRSECQANVSLNSRQNSARFTSNLEASLDWLTIATEHSSHQDLQAMVNFIEGFIDDEFFLEFGNQFSPGRGCKKYEHSGSSLRGCRIGWNVDSQGTSKTWLSIPGQVLRQISVRDAWRLCSGLSKQWGADCRRFDAALDDYQRRVSPHEVLRACQDGDVALVQTYQLAAKSLIGEVAVPTIYFGSRESEKFVRFYDAERKHGSPCDRWEVELKRRHSQEAFNHFVNLPFDSFDDDSFSNLASHFLAGLVVGAIDFRKAKEGERYSRRERLDWWESLVEEVGAGIRLSPARPKPSLERSLTWFKRQVCVFISALKEGWGVNRFNAWITDGIMDGKSRQTAYHEALIRQLKRENELPEAA